MSKSLVLQEPRTYGLLGLRLRSWWALDSLPEVKSGSWDVELSQASPGRFAELPQVAAPETWFRHSRLEDGSDYLRWGDLFEFLVSPDGTRIEGRSLEQASDEIFQTYLLGQTLSFALLKMGVEPIHATVVAHGGTAVALTAGPGSGKTTLAAEFLHSGGKLLTDDLMVLREESGRFSVQPGSPRIKLFPDVAGRMFPEESEGVAMNPDTQKLILPLDKALCQAQPAPLAAIYVLRPPRPDTKRVIIRRLTERNAFLELTRSTFNTKVFEPDRLRQQFSMAASLAAAVPVKSLSYPRRLDELSRVREAVLADLPR